MKKIYLGIIIIFILTLIGCGTTANQQRHDQSGNPSVSPTTAPITIPSTAPTTTPITTPTSIPATAENVVTPNAVTYYNDENHKMINFGKLSIELRIFHIVSETFNGSDYIIGYKEDQSISGYDHPVKNMIIREIKDLELLDKESIKAYLVKMMPSYENIEIYNKITDASGIKYLAIISGGGKSYYVVNLGDTSYLINSELDFLEDYIINTVRNNANYKEKMQDVECANSFSASIHEIIDYETETIKYKIIQGKSGKKYSAELSDFGGFESYFTLKDDNDKNLLNITSAGEGPYGDITFIDVNLDGYVDIQVLDDAMGNDSTYHLYVWDEMVNNFVKVKCETEITCFEVNDGYLLLSWRGVELIWKDNKTLELEEGYRDYLSDFDLENRFQVFEDQSFDVNLENFGNVRFVSGKVEVDGISKLWSYLVKNKEIIYVLPGFYGNILTSLEEVDAVSFRDLNNDGLKDITIITYYIAANGDELPMAGVYFQKDMEFINSDELDTEINSTNNNTTIDAIKNFLNKLNLSSYGIN